MPEPQVRPVICPRCKSLVRPGKCSRVYAFGGASRLDVHCPCGSWVGWESYSYATTSRAWVSVAFAFQAHGRQN